MSSSRDFEGILEPESEDSTIHDLAAERRRRQAPPPLTEIVLGDRYRLEQLIGQGSTAAVYRARDTVLDETVAVKVICLDGRGDAQQAAAFEEGLRYETRAALRLAHPNIVRVYTYGRSGAWCYLVMEHLPGESLHQAMDRRAERRLSTREILRHGVEVLDALAYAHGVGVLHNDVKPGNLLLARQGGVKVADFGLAKINGVDGNQVLGGTPAYMAPERIRGGEAQPASDLYSLSATLFALGNGRPPFGTATREALQGHVEGAIPDRSALPPHLHAVVVRGLAKDPAQRFADATEMRAALMEAARVELVAATRRATPFDPAAATDPVAPRRVAVPPERRPAAPRASAALEPVHEFTDLPSAAARTVSLARPARQPAAPLSAARLPEPEPAAVPPKARPVPTGLVRVPDTDLCSDLDGRPARVPAFHIERLPVTNGEYAAFLESAGGRPPSDWPGTRPPRGLEAHPVTGVSLDEARAYAAWRGRRLPTALEWEAAARGGDGRHLPWGDAGDPERWLGPHNGKRTEPVGRRAAGASPCGCLDLVGNVWEWATPDAGRSAPEAGHCWVLGGSFLHPGVRDGRIARSSVSAEKSYDYLGFRCATVEEAP